MADILLLVVVVEHKILQSLVVLLNPAVVELVQALAQAQPVQMVLVVELVVVNPD